jgi:hypothetical protein
VAVPRWKIFETVFWRSDGVFALLAEPEGGELSGRHQLLEFVPGREARRLTNDLNDYHRASFSTDGSMLAALQLSVASRIWISQDSDPASLRAIGTGRGDGSAWIISHSLLESCSAFRESGCGSSRPALVSA